MGTDEADIRGLLRRMGKSFKARDLEGLMSCYLGDDSLLIFDDNGPPREVRGATAWKRSLADFFADSSGELESEVIEPRLIVEGDFAYAHCCVHNKFVWKGLQIDNIVRSTLVLRRIEGRWLVVHQHASVPYNYELGRGELDAAS